MLPVRSSLNWARAHDVMHTTSYWESFVSNMKSRDIQGVSGGKVRFWELIPSVLEESSYEYLTNYEALPGGKKRKKNCLMLIFLSLI